VHITEERLQRVEAFFARYGLATILIGRFVGLVRAVAPFLAGASDYPARRFVALAGLGTGLWCATFVLLGYLFWHSLDEAIAIAKRGSFALGGVVAVAIALVAGYHYLRGRARARESSRGSDPPGNDGARSDGGTLEAVRNRQHERRTSAVGLQVGSEDSR
jgi:undecaprenyl-diphosphatase